MTTKDLLAELAEIDEPMQTADEEVFDFTAPEDVLIEVIKDSDDRWGGFSIETCTVIRGKEGVTGAASYDQSYGGFLDYTIKSLIAPPGEGWFVVVGITGHYTRGDGWTTDDDMTFEFQSVRPATEDEIKLA